MAEAALNVIIGAKSNKLAGDMKRAKGEFENFSKHAKTQINNTSKVFDSLGDAVGGVVGKITDGLTSLATSGGPIALVTAAVGLVVKVWKDAKDNMDLFLKSADKLKYGFAGYTVDSEAARKDTKKRAKGQFDVGFRAAELANRGLVYDKSTETQKVLYREQLKSSLLMQKDAQVILDQVRGIEDKFGWELKYNGLLQEQETLSDAALANITRWAGYESDIKEQRLLYNKAGATALEKSKASAEIERIANILVKEKTAQLDKQITNTNALAEMTMTQEVVEDKVNGLMAERNVIKGEYYNDLLKSDKMEKGSLKTTATSLVIEEKRLKAAKDANKEFAKSIEIKGNALTQKSGYNATTMTDDKSGAITMPTFSTGMKLPNTPITAMTDAIQKKNIATQKAIEFNEKLAESEEKLQVIFDTMEKTLSQGANSFKEYGKIVKSSIKEMIGAMIAEGVTTMILAGLKAAKLTGPAALILGPILAAAGAGIARTAFNSLVPSFAVGGIAGGGLSLVGERGPELVNLPRGSQVFSNSQSSNMMGGNVVFRIEGSTLVGVLNTYNRKINSYA